jgi:hypothetical protein
MTHYHCLDWLAMCLTFCAIYWLGNKSRIGFTVMMLGNLLWCVIGLWAGSYAMVVANLGFFSMNVRGFVRWAPPGDTAKPGEMRSTPARAGMVGMLVGHIALT